MTELLAQAWLAWTLSMVGWTALLVTLAYLADLSLGARIRPAWRIALYLPVLLRLLIPLDWATPLGFAPVVVQAQALSSQALSSQAHPIQSWALPLLSIWALGSLLLAARRLLAWARISRLLAQTTPAPSFEGARVRVHASAGPLVTGLLRPTIVLPAGLVDGRLAVLAHERTHLRRADPWLAEGLAWALVLLWPIAPLWAASSRLHLLMELATDDAVTRGKDPRSYARTLVQLAAPTSHATLPALGAVGSLRERIEALRDRRHLPKLAQTTLVLALAGVALSAAAREPSAALPPSPFADTTGVAVLFAELPEDNLRDIDFSEPLCRGAQDWEDGGQMRLLSADEAHTFVEQLGMAGTYATGANTLLLREGVKTVVASPTGVLGDLGDSLRVSLLEQEQQLRVGIELAQLEQGTLGLVEQTALPLQDVSMAALLLPADPKLPGVRRLVLVYASDEAGELSSALPWQDHLGVTPLTLGESELW